MKKKYEKVSVVPVGFEPESCILKGSDSNQPIMVNEVKVEEYHQGFEEGFQDITFE